jgi:hypothetical protein
MSEQKAVSVLLCEAESMAALALNDPEPGRTSPTYSGGAAFILSIEGSPALVANTECKRVAAGAGIVRRK